MAPPFSLISVLYSSVSLRLGRVELGRAGIDNGYSTRSSSVATTGFIAERAADRFLVASLTSDHFIRLGIDQYLVRLCLFSCAELPLLRREASPNSSIVEPTETARLKHDTEFIYQAERTKTTNSLAP